MNTQVLIEKITKAINYAFKSDGTSPGLTISWLHKSGNFYTSIVRWVNGEKIVVCSAQAVELNAALKHLCTRFLDENPKPINPIDELANFIIESKESGQFPLYDFKS